MRVLGYHANRVLRIKYSGPRPLSFSTVQEDYLKSIISSISPVISSLDTRDQPPESPAQVQPVRRQKPQNDLAKPSALLNVPAADHRAPVSFPNASDIKMLLATETLAPTAADVPDTTPIPISSLLHPNQTTADSIHILHKWFHELNLNRLTPVPRTAGNLAPYVTRSNTLTMLVRLGVDLSKIETIPGAANMLVKQDLQHTIEPLIWKLNSHGFNLTQMARLLSVYPKLIKLPLEDIDSRIGYFIQHGFSPEATVHILTMCPRIFGISSVDVDRHLGHVQSLFTFTGDDMRRCITTVPALVTHPLGKIKDIYVLLSKMMGFTGVAIRSMIVAHPPVMLVERDRLRKNFLLLHSKLELPLDLIELWPSTLTAAPHVLSQRTMFLKRRGLLQVDPTRPLYTPLDQVLACTDSEFCHKFAQATEKEYDLFLRTL